MCWSSEVAAFFTVLEVSCLLYVGFTRGLWGWVLGVAPVVLQEAIQVGIWWELEGNGSLDGTKPLNEGKGGCTRKNEALSLLEQVVITILPLWWSFWASRSLRCWVILTEERPKLRHFTMGSSSSEQAWLALNTKLAAVGFALFLLYSMTGMVSGFSSPFCTIQGPHGHQLWAFMVPKAPFWLLSLIESIVVGVGLHHFGVQAPTVATAILVIVGYPAYLCLVSLPIIVYRGEFGKGRRPQEGWLPHLLLCFLGPPTVICLFVLIGPEFGSVWCWMASVSVTSMVVEPLLTDFMTSGRAPHTLFHLWSGMYHSLLPDWALDASGSLLRTAPLPCIREGLDAVDSQDALLTSPCHTE